MHRKVVTVLFCDVVGSTSLGESTDPEALQALLLRYFEHMKAIVERHGGTVEKFIGDAVMAVFGIPISHEDDALRAVRAADEMRQAFPALGIQGRIGVNTGEVVTETAERLATGDAVNVAARLQGAAEPDEILLGEATFELVRSAVEFEALAPLTLKGKAEPVPAYRLVAVTSAPERSHGSRFVGRGPQLGEIRAAWSQAKAQQRCQLLTIVGDAGVGKSRLIAEALAGVDARIVRGRCLPYGEGITYWPVVEAVKHLDATPADPAVGAAIGALLGDSDRETSADEIAWAFRKLLEQEAPVVVVFDDIHWGEETFLDLVESASLFSTGSSILIVALARPDLLERRPRWPVSLRLDPLPPDDVEDLLGQQVGPDLRERIARASGGNPLFLTEMLAMAGTGAGHGPDGGNGHDVQVPPNLRALLAARLDQLDVSERDVLERGAIEGETFHRGALIAMAPEGVSVNSPLAGLLRKELIRAERAQIPGEDAFQFRHLLLRDTAYEALPKSRRAQLHERFAGWLLERAQDLVELDDIAGYHLERAAIYRRELGMPDTELADRASERLTAAARRARWLGDEPASAKLFERALALTRPHRLDMPLELDYADALWRENSLQAGAIADAAADRARAAGDAAGEVAARVAAAVHRRRGGAAQIEVIDALARAALPVLEATGDDTGLFHVWRAISTVHANRGQYAEARSASERSEAHFRRAGWSYMPSLSASFPSTLANGPTPADEALEVMNTRLPPFPHPRTVLHKAVLLAMLGRFDEAWRLGKDSAGRLHDRIGDDGEWALAHIARFQDDHAAAVEYLFAYIAYLRAHGAQSYLSTSAPRLARELWLVGRVDEAEPFAQLGRELGDEQDIATQMTWRQAQALVDASRGNFSQAIRLANEAVAIGDRTDTLNNTGDAYLDLAEVLRAAGRREEARTAVEGALDRYGRKKNLAMVGQVRSRFAELLPPVTNP
jgi:class 3 adenylate cyclase